MGAGSYSSTSKHRTSEDLMSWSRFDELDVVVLNSLVHYICATEVNAPKGQSVEEYLTFL